MPGSQLSNRELVRWITAILTVIVLLAVFAVTIQRANGETAAGADLSAVQIIQVYAESCFYAITTIGVAIAIYIGVRND